VVAGRVFDRRNTLATSYAPRTPFRRSSITSLVMSSQLRCAALELQGARASV
jgi:hypothetical protein